MNSNLTALCIKFQHLHLQCMHTVLHVPGLTLDVMTSAHGMLNELPTLWTFSGLNFSLCFCCRCSERSYVWSRKVPPKKYVQDFICKNLWLQQ